MNNLAFGANPSPKSIQDIHAHQVALASPVAPLNSLIDYNFPQFNQRAIGICTAADLVDLARLIWGIEFSASFTYWGGKGYDGDLKEGSSNLSMLRYAKNVGFLPLTMDPTGNDTHGTYADFLARKKTYSDFDRSVANTYRITGYAICPLDPIGFAQALANSKYGLITRMSVGDNFYRPSWLKSDLELLKAPNPSDGGHSIKVIGYDGLDFKQTRTLRNSWGGVGNPTLDDGTIWCGDGNIKYEYDTQKPFVTEAYVVYTDPMEFKHKFTQRISKGETSAEVVALQRILIQFGFLVIPPRIALGYYGDLTQKAVLAFQIEKGITNNGGVSVGPATMESLNKIQGIIS